MITISIIQNWSTKHLGLNPITYDNQLFNLDAFDSDIV